MLPSEDKEECFAICNERLSQKDGENRKLDPTEIEANRNFIFDKSNYLLAKRIFYTKGKTALEVARAISECLG